MIDRKLRFCMITTFYPPFNFGGDGIFVHNLSNELARLGHQVDVIHCIDSYRLLARNERKILNYDDHPNVTVHGLKSDFGFLSPLSTQQTGFPFFKSGQIQKILNKGFDVIHYHNISLIGGPKILEYGKGIKLYTMHEYWLICPTHVLFRFRRAACERPHCFLCSLSYLRPPQWWRYTGLLKSMIKHVDAFISPSNFVKVIQNKRGLEIPIVHLPNFISFSKSRPTNSEQYFDHKQSKPFFLFVGRLEKLKGLQTIIPLFRRYEKAQLFIAGKGSYEHQLLKLAKDSPNIRFLGYLTRHELRTLLYQSVALIFPSISFEVFSLVIIEAFGEKTPVIVRRMGAMPEIVKESGGGIVYETEEELLAAIDRLLVDQRLRKTLGLRGFSAFLQKYTAEQHLKGYFKLIRDIKES